MKGSMTSMGALRPLLSRGRLGRVASSLLLGVLVSALAGAPASGGEPTRKLSMGVAMEGNRDLQTLDDFTASVGGHAPALWTLWVDWGGAFSAFPAAELMDGIVARDAVPMINWSPIDSSNKLSPKYEYKRIIAGKHDPYIRSFAEAALDWGGPVILRFAFEMNGNWFPWGAERFTNTPVRFQRMWRHVWNIFRGPDGVGATNVSFLWSPYRTCGCPSYGSLYPGDKYVQYTGFSAFNWARDGRRWIAMVPLYTSSVAALRKVAKHKRIIIAETASSPKGGDKPTWIRKGYPGVYAKFPTVKAIVYFNVRVTGHPDWRLPKPAAALAAYATVAAKPAFQGRLD